MVSTNHAKDLTIADCELRIADLLRPRIKIDRPTLIKIQNSKLLHLLFSKMFGALNIGIWNLFVIWCLGFGISGFSFYVSSS
jgi:hypothetical protein